MSSSVENIVEFLQIKVREYGISILFSFCNFVAENQQKTKDIFAMILQEGSFLVLLRIIFGRDLR